MNALIMKIAVCLSGQPRSIERSVQSILNFFNNPNYSVDYFCHVWDYNTWKTKIENKVEFGDYEPVDTTWLSSQLARFGPKRSVIGNHAIIYPEKRYMPWGSLFYSMYHANMLKLQYEIENNFKYDFVVKSRFDVVFAPGSVFRTSHEVRERHLYFSHTARMKERYNIRNASDPFFYGDSWGMDIITDAYRYVDREYKNPYTKRLDQIGGHDPGTYISMLAYKYNVIIDEDKINPADTIFRKEAMQFDVITEFDKILKVHQSYYE
jgi:hypothetical protein